ncbi:MAG: Lrp/AsnC ligand binding domain-containing protein [Nanoarchaeota archaeon]|nr:Lrp/AsnC ligand binding domain-containing protein [Nanoarchaeota archaeon]
MNLTKSEMQIITALRKNARESLTKISRKTGIPVSTIFDKIKENPLITKSTCLLDFNQIGFNTRAKVTIRVERETREELRKYLNNHQNVNSLYKINSGYDFLIELVFRNIKELEDFMEKIRDKFKIIEDNVFYILEDIKREDFMNDENMGIFA